MLSVVVPVYNVRDYLLACLESLAGQTYDPIEVVVVDDGSTDGSGRLADDFAAGRDHWTVLHVDNGGLGRARNIGFDASTGDYIAFVDSDDLVPTDAYELMMRTIVRSGSDIVSGGVLRFDGAQTFPSPLHRLAITGTRVRTHIRRTTDLIYDTTAWNKVFRRAFLLEHGLRAPEGVFYEDIPFTLPAHFLARSVDVITQPVYLWRERQTAEQSITQRRAEVKNLEDRMAAVEAVDRFLDGAGTPEDKRLHERKALRIDIPLFVDVLHAGDEEFFHKVVELCGAYLRGVDPGVVAELVPLRRLQYHLIAHGMEEELHELVEFLRVPAHRGRFVRHGIHLYADLPFLRDSSRGVPDSVYRVSRSQPLTTGIRDVWWEGGDLRIDGHAFIHRVSDHGPLTSLHRIQLRRAGSGQRHTVPAKRVRRPDLTAQTTGAAVTYDGAGFLATIPAAALRLSPGESATEFEVLTQVATPIAQRGSDVQRPELSRARHPRRSFVAEDQLAIPAYRGRRLRIAVRRTPAVLTDAEFGAEDLVLRLRPIGRASLSGARLYLSSDESMEGATVPVTESDGEWSARIPLERLGVHAESVADRFVRIWVVVPDSGEAVDDATIDELVAAQRARLSDASGLRLAGPDGKDGPLALPLELDPGIPEIVATVRGRLLVVEAGGLFGATIRDTSCRPLVTSFAWEPEGLRLEGLMMGSTARTIELVHHAERRSLPLSVSGERWSAFLPRDGRPGEAVLRWLTPGEWSLVVEGLDDARPVLPLRMSGDTEQRLGEPGDYPPIRLLLRSSGAHEVRLAVDGAGSWSDRGKLHRERARRYDYRLARRLPLEDVILFEAWKGRQYADNPRAIHEELVRRGDTRRMIWAVEDHGVEVPEGVETVIAGGREYYRRLGRARWLVTNDSMRPGFVKRTGSRYGQTWHGTPLKRIGFDIENLQMSNPRYLVQFERDKNTWDSLVSPNHYSTEIFRRAFRYDGPVLEIGYPRNDVFFHDEERRARTEATRARLNLPPGRRVVLYAPTWRDNQYDAAGRYQMTLKLDLEQLHRELGDSAIVLVRGHQLVAAQIDTGRFGGFVRNVSGYPDISDLYLVSDVLITDYSSVMFDFVNTGRPMLFFTYDLESYRDDLRGFYFDFEAEAPGPLLTHTMEVIEALTRLDEVSAEHAASYARFRERFASLEDGKAAARFVEAFLDG
ncbi:putative CDP-glycerol:poly(Glycerophosphate)glycerophosph otransferase [Nostocoides japonicum T1-X7]|uniref:Putative CDP-glycerol:poly(Glycerophosphate)glycerophosph otransferase n=1 Tax=Nostocoides japonicum T1-X7 TaxID=1194083 RepID=A0A077M5A3_9MICO|nr:putative CDP-glycerol:poly(Glycerophosphate)glycerophosph otransferase [Tetrasphaera japonica T1-X7]